MAGINLGGLSLRDLEYAVAVGQLRHFGRAAERCNVSQSALSEQVRKLEAALGVTLFERTRRRVEPTPLGRQLLQRAEAILADARGLMEAGRALAEPLSGDLRLGVIPTLAPYYIPLVLRPLRTRFPRLALRLEEARTGDLVRMLRAGELDAVLVALPLGEEGFTEQPVFFEPFRLVSPATHRLASRPNVRLRDLPGPGLLLLEEGHCLRDQALALCNTAGAGTRFATSLEMLRHMIAAGEGYSLLPLLAVDGRPELDALLCVRGLADGDAGRRIGLAWRSSDPRQAEFATLAAFLRDTAPAGTSASREEG